MSVGAAAPSLMWYFDGSAPNDAVKVAVCAVVTAEIVAVKPTLVAPAAIVTEAGTTTAVSSLDISTTWPPLPAAVLSVTVQLSVPAPVIDPLVQLNPLRLMVLLEPVEELLVNTAPPHASRFTERKQAKSANMSALHLMFRQDLKRCSRGLRLIVERWARDEAIRLACPLRGTPPSAERKVRSVSRACFMCKRSMPKESATRLAGPLPHVEGQLNKQHRPEEMILPSECASLNGMTLGRLFILVMAVGMSKSE